MPADGEINQKNMEKRILTIIQERMEQMENDYLMSLIVLKACVPDSSVPLFNIDALEEKAEAYVAKIQPSSDSDSYLTVKEAMSILNVSRSTLFEFRKRGWLTSYPRERNVYLRSSEVRSLRKKYSEWKGKV